MSLFFRRDCLFSPGPAVCLDKEISCLVVNCFVTDEVRDMSQVRPQNPSGIRTSTPPGQVIEHPQQIGSHLGVGTVRCSAITSSRVTLGSSA